MGNKPPEATPNAYRRLKQSELYIRKFLLNHAKKIISKSIDRKSNKNSTYKFTHEKILVAIAQNHVDATNLKSTVKKIGKQLTSSAISEGMNLQTVTIDIISLKKNIRDLLLKNKAFEILSSIDVFSIGYEINDFYDQLTAVITEEYHNNYRFASEKRTLELEESEKKLHYQLQLTKNITESTATIIFVAGADGNINFINTAAEKSFGYTLDELKGKSLHEIIHYKYPDGSPFPIDKCPLGHVFRDGKPVRNYEGIFFRKDGSRLNIICSNMPIKENGRTVGEVLAMHDVTAMRGTEKNLIKQMRLNELITDNATLGYIMTDTDHKCTFMNPAAEKITGYTFSEIKKMDKPFHDIIHFKKPDGTHYPIHDCSIVRAISEKGRARGEEVFIHPDGSFYPVAYSASPIVENDKPIGTVIEIRDIYIEKMREQAIKKSEAEFRDLADSMPQLIWTINPDGKVNYVNKKLVDFLRGRKIDSFGDWLANIHPDDSEEANRLWKLALKNRTIYEHQERINVRKDKYRWFLTRAVPIIDNSKKIIKWYATATDIDEQKLSEHRFIATLKNSPIVVAQTDKHGKYTWMFNSQNIDSKKIIGKTELDLMPGSEGAKKLFALKTQALKFGKKITEEVSFQYEKSRPTFSFVIEPTLERKKVTGLTLVAFDITARKKLEKEKHIFLGVASHELKTPLTSVKLFAHILKRRLEKKGDEKDLYFIKQLNYQTDKMTELIGDLLNMSKIETGMLKFNIEKFTLDTFIKRVIDDFSYVAENYDIAIEGSVKRQVFADPSRIEQVMVNLLTNAVKYSPGMKKINISLCEDGDYARVCVRDFGIGIAKKDTNKIFERFYRTHDKKKK